MQPKEKTLLDTPRCAGTTLWFKVCLFFSVLETCVIRTEQKKEILFCALDETWSTMYPVVCVICVFVELSSKEGV